MQAIDVETRAIEAICAHLGRSGPAGAARNLTADSPLLNSGILDSLGILQLMTHLAETLQVEIGDEDFVPGNFETIGSLARLVSERQRL